MTLDDQLIQKKLNKSYHFKLWKTLASLIPINIGYTFKVLHWPSANALIIMGWSFFIVLSFSAFLRLKGSNPLNNLFTILSILCILLFLAGPTLDLKFPFSKEVNYLFWNETLCFLILNELFLQVKYKVSIFTPKKLFTKKGKTN